MSSTTPVAISDMIVLPTPIIADHAIAISDSTNTTGCTCTDTISDYATDHTCPNTISNYIADQACADTILNYTADHACADTSSSNTADYAIAIPDGTVSDHAADNAITIPDNMTKTKAHFSHFAHQRVMFSALLQLQTYARNSYRNNHKEQNIEKSNIKTQYLINRGW